MFAPGPQIEPGDLPLQIGWARTNAAEDEYSLDGLEQQTIRRVLAQTGGHQQKAADLLGISRRTLIRKLKLYRSPEALASGKRRWYKSMPARERRLTRHRCRGAGRNVPSLNRGKLSAALAPPVWLARAAPSLDRHRYSGKPAAGSRGAACAAPGTLTIQSAGER